MNVSARRADLTPPFDALHPADRAAFERLSDAGLTLGSDCHMTALGLTIDRSPLLQYLLSADDQEHGA